MYRVAYEENVCLPVKKFWLRLLEAKHSIMIKYNN